jgi:uncharacterized membrane protein
MVFLCRSTYILGDTGCPFYLISLYIACFRFNYSGEDPKILINTPCEQTFWKEATNVAALASTAILISLGLVASAFRAEITSSAIHALNVFGHTSETLWIIKLFVLSALFFYAFFNFTLSIRYYNHASFLINVPQDLEPSSSVDSASLILNHGALHYTFGMRGFYLAIPLGLWLFGPFWMLGGSVLIVFILYRLDREV